MHARTAAHEPLHKAGQLVGDKRIEIIPTQFAIGHDVAADLFLQPKQLNDGLVRHRFELIAVNLPAPQLPLRRGACRA